jgi:hypothetical protein
MALELAWFIGHNFAHARGIWLDCDRRGRPVSGWSAFAFWFGPVTVLLYLAAEYRSKSFIPVTVYIGAYSLLVIGGRLLMLWIMWGRALGPPLPF